MCCELSGQDSEVRHSHIVVGGVQPAWCRFRDTGRALIVTIFAMGSLGCVGVIPLAIAANVALVGYPMFKAVQLAGGGTAEVRFSKRDAKWTAEQEGEIQKLGSVAVLPGEDEVLSVAFAGALSSKTNLRVTTPHQVHERSSVPLQEVSLLTTAEMEAYWRSQAAALGVDAVLEIVPTSPPQDRMNMFSLKKPEQMTPFFLAVAPRNQQAALLRPSGKLVLRTGTKMPSKSEVYGAFADMLAERIAQARVTTIEANEARGE